MTLMSAVRKGFKLDLAYESKNECYTLEMVNNKTKERIKLIKPKEEVLKIYGFNRLLNHLAF